MVSFFGSPVDNGREGGNTLRGRSSLAPEFLHLLLLLVAVVAAGDDAVDAVAVAVVEVAAVVVAAVAAEMIFLITYSCMMISNKHTC